MSRLDKLKVFFSKKKESEEPEVQSYEQYKKDNDKPIVESLGGFIVDAIDTAEKTGKAISKSTKKAVHEIVTPRYKKEGNK